MQEVDLLSLFQLVRIGSDEMGVADATSDMDLLLVIAVDAFRGGAKAVMDAFFGSLRQELKDVSSPYTSMHYPHL